MEGDRNEVVEMSEQSILDAPTHSEGNHPTTDSVDPEPVTEIKEQVESAGYTWVEYFCGKALTPKSLLTEVGKGLVPEADDEAIATMSQVMAEKPERLKRLIDVLEASRGFTEPVVGEVSALVIKLMSKMGIELLETTDPQSFKHIVTPWLDGLRKPLSKTDMYKLFVLLLHGHLTGVLDGHTAFSFVRMGTETKQATKHQLQPSDDVKSEWLLDCGPSPRQLAAMAQLYSLGETKTSRLQGVVEEQLKEMDALRARVSLLELTLQQRNQAVEAAESRVATLEEQLRVEAERNTAIIDGYRHRLDTFQGRVRGVMQDQLTRWIENALDASRDDPPWTQLIQERLEDALSLIKKEMP